MRLICHDGLSVLRAILLLVGATFFLLAQIALAKTAPSVAIPNNAVHSPPVVRSQVVSAPIDMVSTLGDQSRVGDSIALQLQFKLPVQGTLQLQLVGHEGLKLSGLQSTYTSDSQGRIDVDLVLIAGQPGKHYVKFIANAQASGQQLARPFAVVVPVLNEDGVMPASNKAAPDRIEMRARRW